MAEIFWLAIFYFIILIMYMVFFIKLPYIKGPFKLKAPFMYLPKHKGTNGKSKYTINIFFWGRKLRIILNLLLASDYIIFQILLLISLNLKHLTLNPSALILILIVIILDILFLLPVVYFTRSDIIFEKNRNIIIQRIITPKLDYLYEKNMRNQNI